MIQYQHLACNQICAVDNLVIKPNSNLNQVYWAKYSLKTSVAILISI